MKKFTVMILCVSTFFVGLGGLVESVGARFKSDERALEIMRLARIAIGGEQNIKAMQALTIKGKASKTFEFDKMSRVERGEWELNLQLPNKMSKMLKIETEDNVGNTNDATFERKVDVVVVKRGDGTETGNVIAVPGEKVTIVRKDENGNVVTENVRGTTEEAAKVVIGEKLRTNADNFQRNEMFRTMIGLFLTPPQGIDAEYTFVGEQSVDGTNCNVIQINGGGSSVKLFLNKSSNLPVMMSYTDAKPRIFTFVAKADNANETQPQKVTVNEVSPVQTAEFQVKFSDFRSVNGLQLPFKWAQTIDGKEDETIEVSAYEFNPANISEKFNQQPQRVMIRTEKPNQ